MKRFALLENLGREITPGMVQGTIALFAEGALRPAADFCSVERNLAYGPHERQRLDLFRPQPGGAPRPIVIFVHGGGFVGGDKGAPDAPFYNNIGAWATQRGFIGATMSYRLAPAATWPAGSDDVASAVDYVRRDCVRFGGNPDAVFLIGQSAGAAHVAGFVAQPQYAADSVLAGAIMMSGLYQHDEAGISRMETAYYGTDTTRFSAQSCIEGLISTKLPCLFSIAELDPDHFQQQTGRLCEQYFRARGRLPALQYESGHNHISPALQIGASDDRVGPAFADFIERWAAQ